MSYDAEIKGLRAQLAEQVRVLGIRAERKLEMAHELNAFIQKQAEIEQEYANEMEKLYEKFSKSTKRKVLHFTSKRPDEPVTEDSPAPTTNTTGLTADAWAILLDNTRKKSVARSAFSQNLLNEVKPRIDHMEAESIATSKKATEIMLALQNEMLCVLKVTDEALKAYHACQIHYTKAEEKFDKLSSKGQASSKQGEKQREKLIVSERQTMNARNNYILSLLSCNAFRDKYFQSELNVLIDTMDQTFFDSYRYVMQLYHDKAVATETNVIEIENIVNENAKLVTASAEKAKFFQEFSLVFKTPQTLEFIKHETDKINTIQHTGESLPEMINQYRELQSKMLQLTRRIEQEKGTLKTIVHIRGKAGALFGVIQPRDKDKLDDVTAQKSIDSAVMYCDAGMRLTLRTCESECISSQIKALSIALGPHKPPPLKAQEHDLVHDDDDILGIGINVPAETRFKRLANFVTDLRPTRSKVVSDTIASDEKSSNKAEGASLSQHNDSDGSITPPSSPEPGRASPFVNPLFAATTAPLEDSSDKRLPPPVPQTRSLKDPPHVQRAHTSTASSAQVLASTQSLRSTTPPLRPNPPIITHRNHAPSIPPPSGPPPSGPPPSGPPPSGPPPSIPPPSGPPPGSTQPPKIAPPSGPPPSGPPPSGLSSSSAPRAQSPLNAQVGPPRPRPAQRAPRKPDVDDLKQNDELARSTEDLSQKASAGSESKVSDAAKQATDAVVPRRPPPPVVRKNTPATETVSVTASKPPAEPLAGGAETNIIGNKAQLARQASEPQVQTEGQNKNQAQLLKQASEPRIMAKPRRVTPLDALKGDKRTTEISLAPLINNNGLNPNRFGAALNELGRDVIPLIVVSCVRALCVNGLHETGLFRVPGASSQVSELKAQFEVGKDPLADDHHNYPPEAVAGVLKLYLRQVEGSVLPSSKYHMFLQIADLKPEARRLDELRKALRNSIPHENFNVLSTLFDLLNTVASLSDHNQMNASNLALVFGPTLLISPDGQSLLNNATRINALVELMIVYQEWIFVSPMDSPNPLAKPSVPRPAPSITQTETKAIVANPQPAVEVRQTTVPVAEEPILTTAQSSANHVESSQVQNETETSTAEDEEPAFSVKALYDYTSRQDTELSFKAGDVLTILQRPTENWWYGLLGDREGYIATAYIETHPQPAHSSSTASNTTPSNSESHVQTPKHEVLNETKADERVASLGKDAKSEFKDDQSFGFSFSMNNIASPPPKPTSPVFDFDMSGIPSPILASPPPKEPVREKPIPKPAIHDSDDEDPNWRPPPPPLKSARSFNDHNTDAVPQPPVKPPRVLRHVPTAEIVPPDPTQLTIPHYDSFASDGVPPPPDTDI